MREFTMPEGKEAEWQQMAQARAERARQKHAEPEGFDTDIICAGEESTCDILPEFHVEQLDGGCWFVCRPHAIELLTTVASIPMENMRVN